MGLFPARNCRLRAAYWRHLAAGVAADVAGFAIVAGALAVPARLAW